MFARVCPVRKLIVDTIGREAPLGNAVRNPSLVADVTARLKAAARAVGGKPQAPPNPKTRIGPAESAGPPRELTGSRVSTSRHGASE